MKKITGVFIMFLGLLTMSGCAIWDIFFPQKSYKEQVAERLDLDLNQATVLDEWNTHGGFHGDGETFVKLSCEDDFERNLVLDKKWRATPLQDEAYQYYYVWGGLFEHPETGEKVIPEIENGYWYFESTGAMNWDFAVFDCEENILYFYEYDA